MNHPGVCVGYRLFTSAGSVAYLPDNELFSRLRSAQGKAAVRPEETYAREQDQKLSDFVRGADVMIADAQYDASEYPRHVGWGHSCVDDVVDMAIASGVKQLFLFHHDPDHGDTHIAQMLGHARKQVAERGASLRVEAAREGAEVLLGK
jgi:phosphoribosyl 1,2-cyclic phosphodiesterase